MTLLSSLLLSLSLTCNPLSFISVLPYHSPILAFHFSSLHIKFVHINSLAYIFQKYPNYHHLFDCFLVIPDDFRLRSNCESFHQPPLLVLTQLSQKITIMHSSIGRLLLSAQVNKAITQTHRFKRNHHFNVVFCKTRIYKKLQHSSMTLRFFF